MADKEELDGRLEDLLADALKAQTKAEGKFDEAISNHLKVTQRMGDPDAFDERAFISSALGVVEARMIGQTHSQGVEVIRRLRRLVS